MAQARRMIVQKGSLAQGGIVTLQQLGQLCLDSQKLLQMNKLVPSQLPYDHLMNVVSYLVKTQVENMLPPEARTRTTKLAICEANEAVINICFKGRSKALRHLHRTHPVAVDWLFEVFAKVGDTSKLYLPNGRLQASSPNL